MIIIIQWINYMENIIVLVFGFHEKQDTRWDTFVNLPEPANCQFVSKALTDPARHD